MNTLQKVKLVFTTAKAIWWLRSMRFAFLLIIFLGLLALKPYFNPGFPYTHDGENHLARFANYKLALREGQLPPRWAPNLHNRYGYPVFNFNYPLANILSLPFSALKINYEVTFKLLAGLFVFSGLFGIYSWLGYFKFSQKAKLFSLSIYGLSPYLFSTILYRGNIGELAAWGIIPWLLVVIEKLATTKKPNDLIISIFAVIFGLFFLTHNVTVLFITPVFIFYSWLKFGLNWQKWQQLILILIYGVLLSLWFWLPALAEKHLIILDNANLSTGFINHFPTFSQLIFSPLMFGFSYVGQIDTLAFSLGLLQIVLATLGSLIFVIRKSQLAQPKIWLGLIILLWLTVLFQLSITGNIWQMLPLAQFIQFPWRLGLVFAILVVPLAGLAYEQLSPKLNIILWLLVLWQILAFSRLQPVDYFHKLNRDYDAFSQTTSTANENMPNRFGYTNIGDWQPTATIVAGDGQINVDYWKGSDRQYQLQLNQISAVVEPTARFAGWVTHFKKEDSENWQQVDYIDNPIIAGRIAYELEAGNYQIKTSFTQWTWPRLIGNTFSLVTILLLAGNLVIKQLRHKK